MTTRLLLNATFLAWTDTKSRYRKSVLGPFWIVLTNVVGVLGLGVVWSHLFSQDLKEFMPTLAIGLIVWQLVSGVLMEAPGIFVREAHIIRNVNLPIWFYVVRLLTRHVINFLHNLLIVAGVVWYFELPVTIAGFLLAALAFVLVIVCLFCLGVILGMVGARFRDVELAVQSAIPLLFFISPVMFRADRFPAGAELIWWNPLSYLIEAIRAPLLGVPAHAQTLLVLCILLCVTALIMVIGLRRAGQRVAYWI